jgi:hypothetical protein
MPSIRNRFYPLHDIDDHDVVPFYSLDTSSGLAGQLVKIITGAANPQNFDGWSTTNVGTNIANTVSYRYEGKAKVTPTVSGDTKWDVLGITRYSTLETDENSMPLKYFPQRAKEIGAVTSGENVPVITKGLFGMWGNDIDKTLGNPQPGNLVVISRSGDGRLAAVDPDGTSFRAGVGATPGATGANAAWLYDPRHVVGKWISSLPVASNTGLQNEYSTQGGYALFTLDCSA